ncbi:hypothetical protein PybrP1_009343 [[Pythium] brassicae (nom. inval.)]|nr:hypothetical protein PybrP1_009343 [[Pythium] brassicae (nom. inval.)]
MSGRGSQSGGRSSEVERIIAAAEVDTTFAGKKARYRGRRSTWPGALGLFLIAAGSVFGIVYYGIKVKDDVNNQISSDAAVRQYSSGTPISDGRPVAQDPDITITNPASYTDNKCQQPNFVSKNGKIVAVLADSSEVQIDIKGVNWLGMERKDGVPLGLWDNTREGSTLYRVGQFLANNNFNAVRLPLTIDSVMRNVEVDIDKINTNSNRAFDGVTNYLRLLSLVVQGLGQFKIGVVLDFHVLSAQATDADTSGLWYGSSIQLADIQKAVDELAKTLCNGKHFNVMGLDLKDGLGASATWGDGSDTDWAAAATALGNHVLKACPKWLVFVQGVQGSAHKDKYNGVDIKNKFIAGSDLTGVATAPIKLATSGKVVYAPKYYSHSFLPQQYFFDKYTIDGDLLKDYVESPDPTLRKNVLQNMDYMFGATYQTGSAVVLSSFGGLLGAADNTTMKTSTRVVQVAIEKMLASDKGLAGGFFWALNPDTYWSFPSPDAANATAAGLVDETWRAANMDVLKNLANMDKMASVKFIPCQP